MFYTVVTESCKNLRALAREVLRGKWKAASIATIVYVFAMAIPVSIINLAFGDENGLSLMGDVYTLLVTGSFTIGYTMYCLSLFRGERAHVGQIFYGFEIFFKALGLFVVTSIFIVLWTLLFIIPGIVAAYRYSMAFYIMADHPEYGIMQCINESKKMTQGNKMKIFLLSLSFIGWIILAAIPAGIVAGLVSMVSPAMVEIATLVALIPEAVLTVYMMIAETAIYEMASGRLRQKSSVIDEPLRREAERDSENETVNENGNETE